MGIVWLIKCSNLYANDFSFKLDPPQVRPGEPSTLVLTLKSPVSQIAEDTAPIINDDLLNDSKHIKVLERELLQENNTVRIQYKITAYETGQFTIPPIELQLGTNSYSSEGTSLKVASSRSDSDNDIREEFGPVSEPLPWRKYLLAVLIFSALIAAFAYLRKKLPVKKAKVSPPPPEVDPLVWLREQLTLLQRAENTGHHLDQLNSILREFYSKLTKNRVRAWTTSEMKSRLRLDNSVRDCIAIMVNSEEIRFANQPPRSDLIEMTEKVFFK